MDFKDIMEDKNLKCCQVLSFECYYKEMVEGSQEEGERHRRSQLSQHIADLLFIVNWKSMQRPNEH